MSTPADRLAALGITLPAMSPPLASYVPVVVQGGFAFVSGQLPLKDGKILVSGKVGDAVTLEDAQRASRQCAIMILAQLAAALPRGLESIAKIVKLEGFVASTPSFTDHHLVMNPCSDLLIDVLGEAGRHARFAVGMAALPLDAAVEVGATVAVAD